MPGSEENDQGLSSQDADSRAIEMNADRSRNASRAATRTALTLDISRGRMHGELLHAPRPVARPPRSFFIQDRPVASDIQYQARFPGAGSTRT